MKIRDEKEADYGAVAAILESAFPEDGESRLVTALRRSDAQLISLVAEQEQGLLGHILFSPVALDTNKSLRLMGLAPMAVQPGHQRRGIGAALIEAGLQRVQDAGFGAVFVLGHPEYYPKFGFLPAATFNIKSQYDVPSEAFMALELQPAYLRDQSGTIHYHQTFSEL